MGARPEAKGEVFTTRAAAVLRVILIVLGRGLLQRRSLALPLTVVVLGLSAATRVPQGPDIMVVLSVLVAILLIRARGLSSPRRGAVAGERSRTRP